MMDNYKVNLINSKFDEFERFLEVNVSHMNDYFEFSYCYHQLLNCMDTIRLKIKGEYND